LITCLQYYSNPIPRKSNFTKVFFLINYFYHESHNISAKKEEKETNPWLPQADAQQRRTENFGPQARQGKGETNSVACGNGVATALSSSRAARHPESFQDRQEI